MKLKRIAAFLTACCVGVMNVPFTVTSSSNQLFINAEEANADENVGNILSYEKYDNYIAITGCDESATSVDIPVEIEGLPVTEIGYSAFSDSTGLANITIPDSVTFIGSDAFSGCTSFESIEVTDNNGYYSGMDGVLFDKNVTEIIKYPDGNKNTAYTILDSVTEICEGAFSGCANLVNVTIPGYVTSIGEDAFYGCMSLESVTIPDSVTVIGDEAFLGCTSLASVTIPDSVPEIGYSTFSGCTNLDSVTILNPDCEIDDDSSTISNGQDENYNYYYNGVIRGYDNSTAQTYAENNGYTFESLGAAPETTEPKTTEPDTTESDTTELIPLNPTLPNLIALNPTLLNLIPPSPKRPSLTRPNPQRPRSVTSPATTTSMRAMRPTSCNMRS